MSFVNTLKQWDEAVACFERGNSAAALGTFLDIQEKNSKIFFNIGCLHLINKNLDAAEKGIDVLQKGEARQIYHIMDGELRGNQLIDYKPLGLRYKLYACEVLHNMAQAHAQLGQWGKAKETLLTALNLRTEGKLSHIDRGLECILKQKLFEPVEVPAKVLFKPNKHYVVSSIVFQDEFSGFAPLQPQTSDELAVVPGNIVFVLNNGADNWASVIFNERRGLVPYNFLERLEITLSSKQDQDGTDKDDSPTPPRREPPTRPQRKSALAAENQSIGDTETESCQIEESNESSLCVVKVHFTYTIAICMVPGLPYTTILEKISNKLGLPAMAITLSYAHIDSGKIVIDEDTRMEDVWSGVHNGRLTLWCELKEGMSEQLQSQTHLMALHSYESSTPEDLEFHQGDTILLLSKVNEDWFEGQCNGKIGIFPASFVEEVPMKDK
ncbi:unnamed protein product [Coregonus sp. 'balchen']|nr:unnamed protein product [Coregonus sp. 'balchen']